MTRAEERTLLERAMAGDRDAAEACIRHHQASLYAYILRMCGRPEVAEDVVQEAFVRALTNLHRFDFRYRFSTWLFTIARRLYVNACQKHKPTYDSDIVGSRAGTSAWGGEARAIDREVHTNAVDALQHALMKLPETQREILVLFHQQDWPIALIASHLRMPEGTVKSHLHRARRKLRVTLTENAYLSQSVAEVWA